MEHHLKFKPSFIQSLPPSIRHESIMQRFLGAVETRIADRQRARWSRFIGCGFVAEDISQCWPDENMDSFTLHYSCEMLCTRLSKLNLRELDELAKWLRWKLEPRSML